MASRRSVAAPAGSEQRQAAAAAGGRRIRTLAFGLRALADFDGDDVAELGVARLLRLVDEQARAVRGPRGLHVRPRTLGDGAQTASVRAHEVDLPDDSGPAAVRGEGDPLAVRRPRGPSVEGGVAGEIPLVRAVQVG